MPRTRTNLADAHDRFNVDNVFHPPWWVEASKKNIFQRKYKVYKYTPIVNSRALIRVLVLSKNKVNRQKYMQTDAISKILQLFRKFFQNPTTPQRTNHSKLAGWKLFRRSFISLLTETLVFDSTFEFLKQTPRGKSCRRSDCNLCTILCKADISLRRHLVGCKRCPS